MQKTHTTQEGAATPRAPKPPLQAMDEAGLGTKSTKSATSHLALKLKATKLGSLVADGTRTETLAVARSLQDLVPEKIRKNPYILVVNKSDLKKSWEIQASDLQALSDQGWPVFEASAKTGGDINHFLISDRGTAGR